MAPQLMAFDLDGTLIFDLRIAQESIDAIRAWQEAGNLAVCATGKSIASTRHALEGTGLRFDYYVTYTGAVVTDADFRVLRARTLPGEVVQEVVQRMSGESGVAVYGTTLDTDDVRFSNRTGRASTEILPHFVEMDAAQIPEHEFVGVPLWVTDPEKIDPLHEELSARYAGIMDCHRNQTFLDLVPPDTHKGTGLAWLDEHHLGGRYETYSIGDSWNDLGMHAWADHSASFPYSPQAVQEATETVVPTAAQWIRRLLA